MSKQKVKFVPHLEELITLWLGWYYTDSYDERSVEAFMKEPTLRGVNRIGYRLLFK